MIRNKLEPGDRCETYSGRIVTIIGCSSSDWARELYPITAWAQAGLSEEGAPFEGHEALTLTKGGVFQVGEDSQLSLDLMTTGKFRTAMLALATDPKKPWTDTPEETFLEIAEAVKDYLLLPK